jgi:uncharacterized protein (DUF924 family)
MKHIMRWFRGGPDTGREIDERFRATWEAALRDELDDWARSVRGRLALVIVLDQFSRNPRPSSKNRLNGRWRACSSQGSA